MTSGFSFKENHGSAILNLRALAAVFGLIFLVNLNLQAQDSLDTHDIPADTLETITIEATHHQLTANAAIGSVSFFTSQDLTPERGSSTSVSDVIAEVPGLIAQDRHNLELGERIMMRGMGWRSSFGIRGIQMVQNGIPLTLADGQTSSTIIEPAAIQRLQAIRGPASGYWGNGSNGVVYLNTQPPADATSVYWRNTAGSYGLTKSYLQWNTNVGDRRISGYSSYQSSNGYRNHNAMEIIRLGANADLYSTSSDHIDLTFAWLAKPEAQSPGSLSESAFQNDRTQARISFRDSDAGEEAYQGQAGVRWRHSSDNLQIESTAYGIRRLVENRLPFGYITLERWAGGLRSTTQYEINSRWLISGGWDLSHQYDDRLERNNEEGVPGDQVSLDQLEKVWNAAGFLQSTVDLEKWRFSASLRYDWLKFSAEDHLPNNAGAFEDRSGKRNFSALSPYVGMQYNTESIRYFANFGTAFQSPTTTELVNHPDQRPGFNPYLDPQISVGGEVGIATLQDIKNLSSKWALFYIDINDLLLPYQETEDGPTFYQNSGSTRHIGLEWRLNWKPQQLPLTLTGSYSLTKANFVDFPDTEVEDQNVPGIPDHLVDARAVWRPGQWHITTEIQWSDSYPANNSNSAYTDRYTDLQLTLRRSIFFMSNQFSLDPFFQVQNILDQKYSSSVVVNAFGGRFYEPALPRSWKAGLSISWK